MRINNCPVCSQIFTIVYCIALHALSVHAGADRSCKDDPSESGWLEKQIRQREKETSTLRIEAMGLLNQFLTMHPDAPERAEALFRLAELHWEQAEAEFLKRMSLFDSKLNTFKDSPTSLRPDELGLDLDKSLHFYEEIIQKHPDFEHSDMVLYLYGFVLNQKGDEKGALKTYRGLLAKYPDSTFVPDAHFALGEYWFSKGRFKTALKAYRRVQEHETPLAYLALYKSAWCHFKLGHVKTAASSFREVLRRAKSKKKTSPKSTLAVAGQLEKEALEDLAMTFSESGGAKEALLFMQQVGGKEYSIKVLKSLGDVFFSQARYNKAIESFGVLLEQFPFSPDNPLFHERIAEAYQHAGSMESALQARTKLAELYGPGSVWEKHNQGQKEVLSRAFEKCEQSLRFVATYRHKMAQKKKDRKSYERSAAAYRKYFKLFGSSSYAPKLHLYMGEILQQLDQHDQAAVHYREASRQSGNQTQKAEASYSVILALNKMIPKYGHQIPSPSALEPTEHEKQFIHAIEEFKKIAPHDPRLVQLRFETARIAYFKGHYDYAANQFLDLVRSHPKHDLIQLAADLALDCFTRTDRWEDLEKQAKHFMDAGTFRKKELGKKLKGFITGAIFQQASVFAVNGKHLKAATAFQRLRKEYPSDPLAPKALLNAAAQFEIIHKYPQAISCYRSLTTKYPRYAPDAMLGQAELHERRFDYKKSIIIYKKFARRFPRNSKTPKILIQAALLARVSKKHLEEAKLLTRLSNNYPKHSKAAQALFLAGLAFEKSGKTRLSEKTLNKYIHRYANSYGKKREANLHLGKILLKSGKVRKAQKIFEACGDFSSRKVLPKGMELKSGAECLFMHGEMLFGDYSKIKLRPPKRRLIKLLGQKAAILKKAEKIYTKVVATGDMEWASAALYRIGDMYAQLSNAIFQSPKPAKLTSQQRMLYQRELEKLAYPIEDKALSAFSISHKMGIKHDYHSNWTIKTNQMLNKLDPANHPKQEELIPISGWADSFRTYPFILKEFPVNKNKARKKSRTKRGVK